jgi:hypothetical protein
MVSVWFGFLGQNRFKPVWLGFLPVDSVYFSVFSVWVHFGSVFSVLGL